MARGPGSGATRAARRRLGAAYSVLQASGFCILACGPVARGPTGAGAGRMSVRIYTRQEQRIGFRGGGGGSWSWSWCVQRTSLSEQARRQRQLDTASGQFRRDRRPCRAVFSWRLALLPHTFLTTSDEPTGHWQAEADRQLRGEAVWLLGADDELCAQISRRWRALQNSDAHAGTRVRGEQQPVGSWQLAVGAHARNPMPCLIWHHVLVRAGAAARLLPADPVRGRLSARERSGPQGPSHRKSPWSHVGPSP